MKTLRNLFFSLYQRSPLLAIAGLAQLIAGIALLIYLPSESRQVLGINLWVKPIKFYFSGAIFTWTVALFLPYLQSPYPKPVRFITWAVAVAMIVENVCITFQAGRGVLSHFNITSAFDGAIFSLMGLFIMLNTVAMIYMTWLFFRLSTPMPGAYLWGIRLGLVLFILGSMVGGVMSGLNSHNIGVPMGGEGLSLTNWSTRGGDLRIAHFIGLHALQFIPLVGYLISLYAKPEHTFRAVFYTMCAAALYVFLTAALFWQAMSGKPLLAAF